MLTALKTDSSGTSVCAAKRHPHASGRAVAVLAIVPGGTANGERRRVKSRNLCEGQQRHGNCAIQRSGGCTDPGRNPSLCTRGRPSCELLRKVYCYPLSF